MNDITVILNGYKRGYCLPKQYEVLKLQSVLPSKIMLWYNYPPDDSINYEIAEKIPSAISNVNLGVWARFAYALNATTEYVCIFDDDIIPGNRWLENCITTIKKVNGLLGTVGLLYENPKPLHNCSYYDYYNRFGWVDNGIHNEEPIEVDLVGHCWFFKRDWLSYFWRELPNPKYNICGEDMHFSYMLQKYANIKTYVPPHPINNKELWGNSLGSEYAIDKNSMWESNQSSITGVPFKQLMNTFFVEQRMKGWKLVNENPESH